MAVNLNKGINLKKKTATKKVDIRKNIPTISKEYLRKENK